jgi:hypothetical protein
MYQFNHSGTEAPDFMERAGYILYVSPVKITRKPGWVAYAITFQQQKVKTMSRPASLSRWFTLLIQIETVPNFVYFAS